MSELRPLAGIRVVDVTSSLAGPTSTQLLAALGADVVKVEPLGGDHARAWGPPFWDGEGAMFLASNAGKRSLAVELGDPRGLEALLRLADRADVLVQSLRPGAAEKHGFGAETVRARNPRLVYCTIGAFGAAGPLAGQPGYDPLLQAASGIMSVTGEDGRPPVRVGVSLIDLGTGVWAALGVLAALYEREKTGRGRHVETSMFEAMCHFNLDDFTHFLSVGQVMGPYSRPHVSQSYVFECADGGWIALHMSSPPKFWENLATAMGVPDMLEREEFATRPARIANYEKVISFLAPIFKSQPRAHWAERLAALEVPHSPILNSKEVLEGELGQYHGVMAECDGPRGKFRTIRNPLHFDGEIERQITAPPELGQDNEEYLGR